MPSNVGQAIKINDKTCREETIWNITEAYGGESYVTDFTIQNRANVDFDIEVDFSSPTDDYVLECLDDENNPIVFPYHITGKESNTWKLKITFDKYIEDNTYDISVIFDFVI